MRAHCLKETNEPSSEEFNDDITKSECAGDLADKAGPKCPEHTANNLKSTCARLSTKGVKPSCTLSQTDSMNSSRTKPNTGVEELDHPKLRSRRDKSMSEKSNVGTTKPMWAEDRKKTAEPM